MPILSNFPGGSSTGGGGIALEAVTGLQTLVSSGKTYVKWTDPDDITLGDYDIAIWEGTLLVRKAGSMPVSRRDGTIVLDSKTKNAYATSYFCDSGLSNGVTYYYKLFPYTTTGTYTDSEDDEFTATPTSQVAGIDDWRIYFMGIMPYGDGKIRIRWGGPNPGEIVSDGVTLATFEKTTLVIKEGDYATSKDDPDAVYTFVSASYGVNINDHIVTGLTNGTTYYISVFPETTDGGICYNTAQRATCVANRIIIDTVPSQNGTLTYTGNAQAPSWNDYDTAKMSVSTTAQTNAGTYSASFTPNADYRWSDGTTAAKTVSWAIGKAAGSLSLSETSIALDTSTRSTTFTVTRAGNGAISVLSSDTSVATVSLSGNTVTVSSVNDKTGAATITVRVAAGTNHNVPADKTCSVVCEFMPLVGTPLNDISWADIKRISDEGLAGDYFSIGDRKAVTLSGTVGLESINGTYYVYIIGINHNSAIEGAGIQFGTFKTALSGGTDICLVDANCDEGGTGQKWFQMNHWQTTITVGPDMYGTTSTNRGGWAACDMRYDILGSTNVAPSSYGSPKKSNTSGNNPSATCATNPIADTLMAALPADLRAVMKPITKYTNNKGNSNTQTYVTATVDYLPLLAEFEVYGAGTHANQYEKNFQVQYAYYSSGNSKLKYKQTNANVQTFWWFRSPKYSGDEYFCCVSKFPNGTAGAIEASESVGIAPIFMV